MSKQLLPEDFHWLKAQADPSTWPGWTGSSAVNIVIHEGNNMWCRGRRWSRPCLLWLPALLHSSNKLERKKGVFPRWETAISDKKWVSGLQQNIMQPLFWMHQWWWAGETVCSKGSEQTHVSIFSGVPLERSLANTQTQKDCEKRLHYWSLKAFPMVGGQRGDGGNEADDDSLWKNNNKQTEAAK